MKQESDPRDEMTYGESGLNTWKRLVLFTRVRWSVKSQVTPLALPQASYFPLPFRCSQDSGRLSDHTMRHVSSPYVSVIQNKPPGVFSLTGVALRPTGFKANQSWLNSLRHQLEAVHARGITSLNFPGVAIRLSQIRVGKNPAPQRPSALPSETAACCHECLFSKLQDPRRLSSLLKRQRRTQLIH